MIVADGVRGSRSGASLRQSCRPVIFWEIVAVASSRAAAPPCSSVLSPGALRPSCPARQLPAAAAAETGRQAVVRLAGPPLGARSSGLPAPPVSSSTRSPTRSRPSRCSRCGRRSRRNVSLIQASCARGLPRLFSSSGAAVLRTCALPLRARELHWARVLFAWSVIAGSRGFRAARSERSSQSSGLSATRLACFATRAPPASVRAVLVLELVDVDRLCPFPRLAERLCATAGILPTAIAIPSTDSVVHGYRSR